MNTTNIEILSLRMVRDKELEYQYSKKITQPEMVRDILNKALHAEELPEEVFWVLTLNTKNEVVGIFEVSRGTINASLVHPREIFKRALLTNANSIILAHNHPSGNATPSDEDIRVTQRLVDVGEMIGIKVLDHVIVGEGNRYTSLKQETMM